MSHARTFCLTALLVASSVVAAPPAASPPKSDIFDRSNLVAWCIVPYDGKKRGPEERAEMLERLGIHRFAYDWRGEHLPHFEDELAALKRHNIELTAVWFPTAYDKDARFLLDALAKHKIHTQLWVMGGGEPTRNAAEQAARVKAEAARIRPIAEAAAQNRLHRRPVQPRRLVRRAREPARRHRRAWTSLTSASSTTYTTATTTFPVSPRCSRRSSLT